MLAADSERGHAHEGRTIARQSPIPYHHQLFEILRDTIHGGIWPPGAMIPSEAQLAETYGISRTVIRSAVQRLTADRLVERIRGRGTVVLRPRFGYDAAFGLSAWPRNLADSTFPGSVVDARLLACGDDVGRRLGIAANAQGFEMTCVHRGEGMPNSLTRLFLRADATPALDELARSHRLPEVRDGDPTLPIQLEERYGVRLSYSDAIVEARTCDESEARALDIDVGQPVFGISTVSYAPDGTPVACARITFCTKRGAFTFTIRHDQRPSADV